jgi:alpha-mannosidase
LRQTVEIAHTYRVPAGLAPDRAHRSREQVPLSITTHVSLSPGIPRLDFVTTVENNAHDHRLRILFPTPIVTGVSRAEGHFDVVERPVAAPPAADGWPEQPSATHHQRSFVHVGDGRIGLLLANRGLPEYEVIPGKDGVTVALTLLRCVGWLSRDDLSCRRGSAGPRYATPGAQCPGVHTFEYALLPHGGGWEDAFPQAHAFDAPLGGIAASAGDGSLAPSLGFVQVEPSAFVLTAIKRPEEGVGLVVRGYNITARPQDVTLRLARPWRTVARTDLAEGPLQALEGDGHVVRFVARPKEIVTLRFDL